MTIADLGQANKQDLEEDGSTEDMIDLGGKTAVEEKKVRTEEEGRIEERGGIAPDGQVLPDWLSYIQVTTTIDGEVFTTGTIVNLPLTYYGPPIPLGTDWVYGGLTSPASTPTAASIDQTTSASPVSTSTEEITTARTTTRSASRISSPSLATISSTVSQTTPFPSSSSSSSSSPSSRSSAVSPSFSTSSTTLSPVSSTSSDPLPNPSSTTASSISAPSPSNSPISFHSSHLIPLLPAILVPLLAILLLLLLLFLCWRRRSTSGYSTSLQPPRTSKFFSVPRSVSNLRTPFASSAPDPKSPDEKSALLPGFLAQHHRQSSSSVEMDDELAGLVIQNQSLLHRLNLGLGRGRPSSRRVSGNTVEKTAGLGLGVGPAARRRTSKGLPRNGSGHIDQADQMDEKATSRGDKFVTDGKARGDVSIEPSGDDSGPISSGNEDNLFFRPPGETISSHGTTDESFSIRSSGASIPSRTRSPIRTSSPLSGGLFPSTSQPNRATFLGVQHSSYSSQKGNKTDDSREEGSKSSDSHSSSSGTKSSSSKIRPSRLSRELAQSISPGRWPWGTKGPGSNSTQSRQSSYSINNTRGQRGLNNGQGSHSTGSGGGSHSTNSGSGWNVGVPETPSTGAMLDGDTGDLGEFGGRLRTRWGEERLRFPAPPGLGRDSWVGTETEESYHTALSGTSSNPPSSTPYLGQPISRDDPSYARAPLSAFGTPNPSPPRLISPALPSTPSPGAVNTVLHSKGELTPPVPQLPRGSSPLSILLPRRGSTPPSLLLPRRGSTPPSIQLPRRVSTSSSLLPPQHSSPPPIPRSRKTSSPERHTRNVSPEREPSPLRNVVIYPSRLSFPSVPTQPSRLTDGQVSNLDNSPPKDRSGVSLGQPSQTTSNVVNSSIPPDPKSGIPEASTTNPQPMERKISSRIIAAETNPHNVRVPLRAAEKEKEKEIPKATGSRTSWSFIAHGIWGTSSTSDSGHTRASSEKVGGTEDSHYTLGPKVTHPMLRQGGRVESIDSDYHTGEEESLISHENTSELSEVLHEQPDKSKTPHEQTKNPFTKQVGKMNVTDDRTNEELVKRRKIDTAQKGTEEIQERLNVAPPLFQLGNGSIGSEERPRESFQGEPRVVREEKGVRVVDDINEFGVPLRSVSNPVQVSRETTPSNHSQEGSIHSAAQSSGSGHSQDVDPVKAIRGRRSQGTVLRTSGLVPPREQQKA
ncbi:hypothetical protein M231_00845 [Tremella mesenterica]|uniref:Uncharacterized protein n=1 Tax=Tremella mesenterica TaxID=5217 RepID=A0A4Q1BV17_TREME|nr:uncharacterized protein TREMEDRAFT_65805 [Tremella mesenterica DSM 1558]EIW66199.1 hypothetical protein TREMEDRAFT_65805 [Tremella mesenterica DSM 1558]RXK41846.1 hypothetical protein M231_00845 [Tremella mesenterica]